MASAAFRVTSGHDFVAGAVLLKHASIFVEVSHKTLVLELRIFSFRGSLAQTLVLELRIFSFRGSLAQNARFRGSLAQNARFGSPELRTRFRGCLAEFARLQDPDASGPKGS